MSKSKMKELRLIFFTHRQHSKNFTILHFIINNILNDQVLSALILVAIITGCGSSSSNESTTSEMTPVDSTKKTITDTFSKQPATGS